jgi:hypothetical protein
MTDWLSEVWPWILAAGAYVLGAARGDLYEYGRKKIFPPPIEVDTSVGHPLLKPELDRLRAAGVQTAFVPPLGRPAKEAQGWTLISVRVGIMRRPQHFYAPTIITPGRPVEKHWLMRAPES